MSLEFIKLELGKILSTYLSKLLTKQNVSIIVSLTLTLNIYFGNFLKIPMKLDFYTAQNATRSFNHEVQLIMDKIIAKAQTKLNGKGVCLFEYISIQPYGTGEKRHTGYVMYSRLYEEQYKKTIDGREVYLEKTHRDINYGAVYSTFKEEDAKDYPFGVVRSVEDLLKRDSQNDTTMFDTFRRVHNNYIGNFSFKVEGLGYSYLKNANNDIIGHPVILCDKVAFDILGADFLFALTKEFHTKLVNYANSNAFANTAIVLGGSIK